VVNGQDIPGATTFENPHAGGVRGTAAERVPLSAGCNTWRGILFARRGRELVNTGAYTQHDGRGGDGRMARAGLSDTRLPSLDSAAIT
jgi:hypothetical protein